VVVINLDLNQLGRRSVVLTDAQLASIDAQRGVVPAPGPVPPGPNPPLPPSPGPAPGPARPYVLPAAVARRQPIVTQLPWHNGTRVYSGQRLTDATVWALAFTTGPASSYSAGRLSGGEYVDQPTFRQWQILRNSDGAVLYAGPRAQTPSVVFVPGAPPPRTGYIQLPPDTACTLALWNDPTIGPSNGMFMDLYFWP